MRDGRIDLGPAIKRVLILPGLGVTLWPESVESALSEIAIFGLNLFCCPLRVAGGLLTI